MLPHIPNALFEYYSKSLTANHGKLMKHISSLNEEERYDILHAEIMGKGKTLRWIKTLTTSMPVHPANPLANELKNSEPALSYSAWKERADDSELTLSQLRCTYLYYLNTQDPEFSIDLRNERRKFLNDKAMFDLCTKQTGLRLPGGDGITPSALYDYALIMVELDRAASDQLTEVDRVKLLELRQRALEGKEPPKGENGFIFKDNQHDGRSLDYFNIEMVRLSRVKSRLEGSLATVKKRTDKMIGQSFKTGHTFIIKDIHFIIEKDDPESTPIKAGDIRILKSLHLHSSGIPGKNFSPSIALLFGGNEISLEHDQEHLMLNFLVLIEYVLGLRESSRSSSNEIIATQKSRFTNKRLLPYYDFYTSCI